MTTFYSVQRASSNHQKRKDLYTSLATHGHIQLLPTLWKPWIKPMSCLIGGKSDIVVWSVRMRSIKATKLLMGITHCVTWHNDGPHRRLAVEVTVEDVSHSRPYSCNFYALHKYWEYYDEFALFFSLKSERLFKRFENTYCFPKFSWFHSILLLHALIRDLRCVLLHSGLRIEACMHYGIWPNVPYILIEHSTQSPKVWPEAANVRLVHNEWN